MQIDPVKRNFIANVFDGALFAFATSLVSNSAVIPVFVKKIGGSNIAVGLIPVIWTLSFYFPQILIANYARGKSYKKNLMLKTAMIQRLPWITLAFVTFFILPGLNAEISLIVFFFFFFIAGLGGSINFPGWFDLVAKITPVNLRGRLFGVRAILGALLGVAGGWIVKIILVELDYPANFTLLFVLAFSIMMISYLFLLTIKEDEPSPQNEIYNYKEFLRQLPEIIKTNHNFRNFLISDSLLIAASTAEAFYALNALSRFNLPDSYAGNFTVIAMVSTIICNLLFGYIADTKGHKINLLAAALATIFACIISILSGNVNVYYLAFTGSAFTFTLISMSRINMVVELSPEGDRPVYIALTNFVTSPFVFAGMLTGWFSTYYGYNIIFIISSILAFCSALWLYFMVQEPRRKRRLVQF